MPRPRNLSPVIENGLCIACGACVRADPTLKLEFDDERQMYQPDGPGGADAAAVCPSVRVDFEDLQRRIFGADATITSQGVVDSVLLAQSSDYQRNLRASSGGLIKQLLLELLSRDEVDGAIALGHVEGLRFEPRVLGAEDVDSLPGSIYHNVAFDRALELLETRKGRYVLVAIPCQLEGIYNYIHTRRPELAERIYTTIGLICGWTYSHHALRAICEYEGVDFDSIRDVAFRGGGPVGKLRLHTAEGEHQVHRRMGYAYQVAFDRSFNVPRCHLCIDHQNFLAEICVGDAWLPSTVGTRTGISLVVCRTPFASDAMATLEARGDIQATRVSEVEIDESQTRRVTYGDFSYALAEYLRESGSYVPEMVGPNRPAARLWSRKKVARFQRENLRKLEHQRARRYRWLYWRKLLRESAPLALRYVRWLFVRILRIKSLLGIRDEIPREKIARFR